MADFVEFTGAIAKSCFWIGDWALDYPFTQFFRFFYIFLIF